MTKKLPVAFYTIQVSIFFFPQLLAGQALYLQLQREHLREGPGFASYSNDICDYDYFNGHKSNSASTNIF